MGTKVILRPGGEQSPAGSFNLTTPGDASGGLATTGAPVDVASAAPPEAGQVLTAIDPTHAEWRVPGLRYDGAVRFNLALNGTASIEPGTWGLVNELAGPPPAGGTITIVTSLSAPPVDSRFAVYVARAVIRPIKVTIVGAASIQALDGTLQPAITVPSGAFLEWVLYHDPDLGAVWGLVSDTAGLSKRFAAPWDGQDVTFPIVQTTAPTSGSVLAFAGDHAEWGNVPPLAKTEASTLQRNQWMFSSQASGAVTAPSAGAGDAFGVYMDGSASATVTARSGQFIISPEGPETDLRVFPPSSITLNGNKYYEWVLFGDSGWRPRIAPASPINPYRFPARVVSTSNIVLSGLQTIDGIALAQNDRVCVAGQTTASANGLYIASAGAWTRCADADRSAVFNGGMLIPVTAGTANADTLWMLTTDAPISLGATALTFQPLARVGGAAALKTTGAAVDVSASAPPSVGRILVATDATHATWQAPASGGAQIDTKMLSADTSNLGNSDLTQLGFNIAAGETVIMEWCIPNIGTTTAPTPIIHLQNNLGGAQAVSRCQVHSEWNVGNTLFVLDLTITTLQVLHPIQQVTSGNTASNILLKVTLTSPVAVTIRPFFERNGGPAFVKAGAWGRCTRGAVVS
jgi:hypothetical protein